jgi:hypothetical protein
MAALARADKAEADRLWDTCPMYSYSCHDLEFSLRVQCISVLGCAFFGKCVRLYNLIQRADIYIHDLDRDDEMTQEHCEDGKFIEWIEHNEGLKKTVSEARKIGIGRIKALYVGFKQFCNEVGLNSEHILATLNIDECCHMVDFYLSSDIVMAEGYVKETKDYFLELWQF